MRDPQNDLTAEDETDRPLGLARRLAWIGLSAVPSGLLVAATAHISTDVAAIPLIWVVPLALYLVSFILAFRPARSETAGSGKALGALQVAGTVAAFVALLVRQTPLLLDLGVTLGLLFVNALIAHRAVYALRPPAARLTEFYLYTSLGGVVGGIFAALVAPQIFSDITEYPLLLAAALVCRPGVWAGGWSRFAAEARRSLFLLGATATIALALALYRGPQVGVGMLLVGLTLSLAANWRSPARAGLVGVLVGIASLLPGTILPGSDTHRSFFGLHRIQNSNDGRFRLLSHGTTIHGAMRLREDDGTPLADVFEMSRRATGPVPAVSIVGLGAGSLACYAQAGQAWTFYEIDPVVIRLARDPERFRFLSECAPEARIVQGDARLTLAGRHDAARVLVIDAFSSDSIPMHLLTREGLGVELAHLDGHGVLALHISNRDFELRHVLARVAAEHGLTLLHRTDLPTEAAAKTMRSASQVVILSRDAAVLREAQALGWRPAAADLSRRPWSDDYANALEAMRDRWFPPDEAGAP